tara:strand:- start:105 stop:689 length:585 start_codon:yes stop_codon:yes gene_type:complete
MKKPILSFLNLFLLIVFFTINLQSRDLIKDLEQTKNHSILINILESNPLFLSIINNSIKSTIFAPTNDAFKNMPERFKNDINSNNTKVTTKLILSHIFSGDTLENEKKKGGLALSLDGSIYYTYDVGDLFVKDIVVQGNPFLSGNYRVIPVNCVMFLQQSSKDKRLDKEIRSKFSLTSCCLQDEKEFIEFYKGL